MLSRSAYIYHVLCPTACSIDLVLFHIVCYFRHQVLQVHPQTTNDVPKVVDLAKELNVSKKIQSVR